MYADENHIDEIGDVDCISVASIDTSILSETEIVVNSVRDAIPTNRTTNQSKIIQSGYDGS